MRSFLLQGTSTLFERRVTIVTRSKSAGRPFCVSGNFARLFTARMSVKGGRASPKSATFPNPDISPETSSNGSKDQLPTSKLSNRNDTHFYSQFNDDKYLKEQRRLPFVCGKGGVPLPLKLELAELLKDKERIRVMCFTWNINNKSISSINSINDLFRKIDPRDRPDVFAVALQELPSTTFRFHNQMVLGIEDSIKDTHRVFCWVRQWSQMLIVFLKKHLCLYTSKPEYQFVGSNAISKPFRTKGAIAICFRILKASFVFISSHFSLFGDGNLRNRILDFRKSSAAFNFRATLSPHSTIREDHSIFNADVVFWFGDLNFRLSHRLHSDQLCRDYGSQLFIQRNTYEKLLEKDELLKCISTKLAFFNFKEGIITFPPTYKFTNGSQSYAKHRVPSYTDRILFWSKKPDNVRPIRYDCVWPITVSDHKAVYGIYSVRVMDPNRSFKSNVDSLDLIIPSNPVTEQILVDL